MFSENLTVVVVHAVTALAALIVVLVRARTPGGQEPAPRGRRVTDHVRCIPGVRGIIEVAAWWLVGLLLWSATVAPVTVEELCLRRSAPWRALGGASRPSGGRRPMAGAGGLQPRTFRGVPPLAR